MSQLIEYIIQVIFISGILYLFYIVFLRDKTFFKLNRYYLILSLILPLIIPVIKIPINNSEINYSLPIILNDIAIKYNTQNTSTQTTTNSPDFFQIAYILICIILLTQLIRAIICIIILYKKSKKKNFNDYILVETNKNISPFSFFKYIFISKKQINEREEFSQIILHEKAHVLQYHSIDNILAEIICAIFWINPIFWLLKNNLKVTHEYLADEVVIKEDFEPYEYFILLFNSTIGAKMKLINNLNQSLTFKRLKMMKKERSPRYARWIYYALVPSMFVFVVSFTCIKSNASNSIITQKLLKINFDNKLQQDPDSTISIGTVEEKPEFPGGESALIEFISTNVQYPEDAKNKGIQGKVFVSFVINKNGKVVEPKIMKGVDPLLDNEALRVISLMPDWKPGTQKGKTVNVSYVLPINFKLQKEK